MAADELEDLCRLLHAIYSSIPASPERVAAFRIAMRDVPAAALVGAIDDACVQWPDRMPTYPQVRTAALQRVPPQRPPQPPAPAPVDGDWPADVPGPWEPLSQSPWIRLGQLKGRYDREADCDPETRELIDATRRELGIAPATADRDVFATALARRLGS